MKLLNNDIKEMNAWLLRSYHTSGDNIGIDTIVENGIDYLKKKYNSTLNELDDNVVHWINYLNSLNSQDYIDFFQYCKKLFFEIFGEEQGLKYYIEFTFGLMEDGENYSEVVNQSQEINQMLLIDYNVGFKYFTKNHKYRIGKRIFHVSRNLGKTIEGLTYEYFYDFWEAYNPR